MHANLSRRIASALGWSEDDVASFSLPALRDLVRPVSPKLAGEITIAMDRIAVPQTFDGAAARLLLDGEPLGGPRLRALAAQAAQASTGGPCPACEAPGPHDDNGEAGARLSFCCARCGEHWDAEVS